MTRNRSGDIYNNKGDMISEAFFDARREVERSQTAPVIAPCHEGMEEAYELPSFLLLTGRQVAWIKLEFEYPRCLLLRAYCPYTAVKFPEVGKIEYFPSD